MTSWYTANATSIHNVASDPDARGNVTPSIMLSTAKTKDHLIKLSFVISSDLIWEMLQL